MLTSKAAEVRGGRAWPSWVGLLHHQGFSPAAHCGSSSLAIVLFWWDLDTEYVPRVVGRGPVPRMSALGTHTAEVMWPQP